jgi:leader peptidase (prepilin peptidase) / N-methyltransferase
VNVTPEWIWLVFVFAVGGCIGSFLNVVIYRLPLDKSIVSPPSSCPSCGSLIAFYDNIPMLSWLVLGGKCRKCKTRISVRYFIIELLTAGAFVGLFVLYFIVGVRSFEIDGAGGLGAFLNGGWLLYVVHILLFSAFVAASAIDMKLWVIPLSICWFVTAVGVVGSGLGMVLIGSEVVDQYHLFPAASWQTGAIAAGAMIGMCISLLALKIGIFKASYMSESEEEEEMTLEGNNDAEEKINHRLEMLREIVFLLPIVVCAFAWRWIVKNTGLNEWWVNFAEIPLINGILGSLWGYCVGCGLVWATRILGTLGFGKEAMGLGDVHLLGAAGAVVGPVFVLIAFFVAPFFGLLWVGCQIFSRKIRQIPYGPFLSLGVFAVMIFHDRIREYLMSLYLYQ